MTSRIKVLFVLIAVGISARASTIATGSLYYTNYQGVPNVYSINYSYDGTTFSLSAPTAIASLSGADGIVFAPDGSLLVGGQGDNAVHQISSGGVSIADGSTSGESYHLSMDPSGNVMYSNSFGGQLTVLPMVGGVVQNGTGYDINGDDTGITSEAFVPGQGWYYINGQPNGGGNVGALDISNLLSIQTSRFHTGVQPAHGMVYDSFTGLLTMFGDGFVGTMDPTGAHTLKEHDTGVCDFDQGVVDGKGHALVAGCYAITFIDYSTSMDITVPDAVFSVDGFTFIDDVAMADAHSPEPASWMMMGGAIAGLGLLRRRLLTVRKSQRP